MLRRSSSESFEFISQLRDLLNIEDLRNISVDEENKREADKCPHASQRLEMPTTPTNKTLSSMAMTPPNSGNFQCAENKNVSPNLKEISEKKDLDTPEKVLLMKQRSSCVIKDVHDVRDRHRESLAMVLSNMCEVAVKRGVKRSVEELVGDDTMTKSVECLRVLDWKLVLFQAMARVSAKTWQSVINITGL